MRSLDVLVAIRSKKFLVLRKNLIGLWKLSYDTCSWRTKELGMVSLEVAFRCPFISTQKAVGYLCRRVLGKFLCSVLSIQELFFKPVKTFFISWFMVNIIFKQIKDTFSISFSHYNKNLFFSVFPSLPFQTIFLVFFIASFPVL